MLMSDDTLVTDITRTESTGFNSPMARKKIPLRILAGLTKRELRIARPTFAAEGPKSALKRATKILGPFPTPRASAAELDSRDFALYFETESEASDRCTELGKAYFFNLVEEQTAPRLPEVLKNFKTIRDCSKKLASTLTHLSFAERHLVNTLWGIHPQASQDRLSESLEILQRVGLPDQFELTTDQQLAPGSFAEALYLMEQYFGRLHYIVNRRYTPKGSTKVDVGGPTNASNIVAPNPRWHLIHEAWEIFSHMPGRDITLKDGNDLQKFLVNIHEWITGDAGASFETPIKDYKRVRDLRDDARNRLNHLRTSGASYSPEEFETAISSGRKGSVPRNVWGFAMHLIHDIECLDDNMRHGHRIPARDLVTG